MKRLLIALSLALVGSFAAEAAKIAAVRAVSADGRDENVGDVLARCRLKAGAEYDAQQCARDVRELRDSGEFEEITANVEEGADGLVVTYSFKRKMRFLAPLNVKGNDYWGVGKITKLADLKDGYAYGEADYAAAAGRIRKEYQKKFFPDVKVTPVVEPIPDSPGAVTVTMVIEEGARHKISDYTFEELLAFDFGVKKDEHFKGLKIIRFDDILKKFACTTIMNIHVKIWDYDDVDPMFEKIAGLIRQYGAEKQCYMMSSSDRRLRAFHEFAPDINLCVGWDGNKTDMLSMTNRALAVGAKKVQLFKPYFDQSSVDYAKKNGILCNVFYADDPDEAIRYIDMGIDCILTNDYLRVSNAVRAHVKELNK